MSETFKAGYRYPLEDPERYDDEYGTGYGYALCADEHPEGTWTTDCWIVNAAGEQHPGLNASPVPVHVNGVKLEQGVEFGNAYGRGMSSVAGFLQDRW